MLQSVLRKDPFEASRWYGPEAADGPVLVSLLGSFRVIRGTELLPLLPESKLGVLLRRLALAGAVGVPREAWTADIESSTVTRCSRPPVKSRSLRPNAGRINASCPVTKCERLSLVDT